MCSAFSCNWAWHEAMMQNNNASCLCPSKATSPYIIHLFLCSVFMGGNVTLEASLVMSHAWPGRPSYQRAPVLVY
jgi:hypothetical protein